jgi:hypothetical protein
LNKWCKAEAHCGDIAARNGDAVRSLQCLTLLGAVSGEEFGQSVGPGALVCGAVELLPGDSADEAVVGGEVDDEGVGARLFEFGGDCSGLTVREREDDDVVPASTSAVDSWTTRSENRGKMGLMSAELLTRVECPHTVVTFKWG